MTRRTTNRLAEYKYSENWYSLRVGQPEMLQGKIDIEKIAFTQGGI
ncbi:MAG: hypothetical protein LH474_10505 [Chamaesiphon sp.]|nr:hypothetical protein [Chamaesiphon sp.]